MNQVREFWRSYTIRKLSNNISFVRIRFHFGQKNTGMQKTYREDDCVFSERILNAAAAAPTPLSIFTTVTPGAQLVSMANSAVNPERAVPYPMLVGSAMTGC